MSENKHVIFDAEYCSQSPFAAADRIADLERQLEENFKNGFYNGILEASRTLRVAAQEHKEVAEASKKILDVQANELAAAVLLGWANGIEINAQIFAPSASPQR